MNQQAMLCLTFIRQAINTDRSDFNRGYVMGFINGVKYDFEPWERQYIDVVANQVIFGNGRAA